MLTIGEADFQKLTSFMLRQYGINLTKKKVLIEGRLSNVIVEKGFKDFHGYLQSVFADASGQELAQLINRLTTNHTFFMRESSHFDFFRDKVLPPLLQKTLSGEIRVWSAGCSSGEEPYTLRMILDDVLEGHKPFWKASLLATDISERAMGIARKAEYSREALENIPKMWKLRYFEACDGGMRVRKEVRDEVKFQPFNLMTPHFPFISKFHVIFCRNVMIYFERDTKIKLINKFYDCLESGGYLFIGHSESVERGATPFTYVQPAIYRKE